MSVKNRSSIPYKLALVVIAALVCPIIAHGQNLLVSVRERSGEPLAIEAFVRVTWQGRGQTIVGTTGGGKNEVSTASFEVEAGEYDIEVEAPGYDSASEHASLEIAGRRVTVYVYMTRTGSAPASNVPKGVVVAPEVQKELQKSVEAMKQSKYDKARKHLEKARKKAPSNADILYLVGILDYTTKDMAAARKQFEAVVASYPTHERSLMMLGQMQFQAKEYREASATLQKATEVNSKNWRAHFLLALSLAYSGDLTKAGIEAARAGELNPEKAAGMRILGAKLLLLEGKTALAEEAFESFVKSYPQDAAVPEAKKYIEQIEEAKKSAGVAGVSASETLAKEEDSGSTPVAEESTAWAPPDVDSGVPPTAVGVGCAVDQVLERARNRIQKQLGDLEKFSATEKIEHQVLDSGGAWSKPLSKDFYYFISVFHTAKLPYYFVEDRTTDGVDSRFPTGIATRGLVSLGFMILNPGYSEDFEFTCEGLGDWNGKPAWQLHFEQKKSVPSHVRNWEYKGTSYPIALKGRMWIGANTYSIAHLDTALREPVPSLRLKREQLAVDYGPVQFRSVDAQLWLPLQGEMYFELLGHRYHHKHLLTNYVLFGVETKDKIKLPIVPPEP